MRRSDAVPVAEGAPPAAAAPLQRLLHLARAQPRDRICVCGPEHLDVLPALARLGFSGGCCVDAQRSLFEGGAPFDLLLMTGPMAPAALAAMLTHALPRLRDGGLLAAREAGLQDDALILQVLAACGRAPGWRVHDMAGDCLVALQVREASAEDLQHAA